MVCDLAGDLVGRPYSFCAATGEPRLAPTISALRRASQGSPLQLLRFCGRLTAFSEDITSIAPTNYMI